MSGPLLWKQPLQQKCTIISWNRYISRLLNIQHCESNGKGLRLYSTVQVLVKVYAWLVTNTIYSTVQVIVKAYAWLVTNTMYSTVQVMVKVYAWPVTNTMYSTVQGTCCLHPHNLTKGGGDLKGYITGTCLHTTPTKWPYKWRGINLHTPLPTPPHPPKYFGASKPSLGRSVFWSPVHGTDKFRAMCKITYKFPIPQETPWRRLTRDEASKTEHIML